MQTIVACSSEADVSEAVKIITSKFKNPKVILFLAPKNSFLQATKLFWQSFPKSVVIGSTSCFSFAGGAYYEDTISAVSFESGVTCSCGVLGEIDTFPSKYKQNVEKAMSKIPATNTICFEFMTAFSRKEDVVLRVLSEVCQKKSIPVVGGGSGVDLRSVDLAEPNQTFVSLNGKAYVNGCVFAFLHNTEGRISLFKENIFVPMKQSFTITAVDFKSQTVLKIDDEVPVKVLARTFMCEEENILFVLRSYPLGMLVGQDMYMTDIVKINEDGTIQFARSVYNFTKLVICHPKNYHEITKSTISSITNDFPKPSFVFLVACFSRFTFYMQERYVDEWLQAWNEQFDKFLGFASFGEHFLGQNFNQLMYAVVFE